MANCHYVLFSRYCLIVYHSSIDLTPEQYILLLHAFNIQRFLHCTVCFDLHTNVNRTSQLNRRMHSMVNVAS